MNKQPLGQDLYSGAASFGRFEAGIGAVIATLIAIVAIIVGIALITAKNIYSGKTTATIVKAVCTPYTDTKAKQEMYICNLNIKYKINNTEYTNSISTNDDIDYTHKRTIDIEWDKAKNDPYDIKVVPALSQRAIGWIVIAVGVFILAAAWLTVYITRRFKFAAAAEGVGGAYGIIRR